MPSASIAVDLWATRFAQYNDNHICRPHSRTWSLRGKACRFAGPRIVSLSGYGRRRSAQLVRNRESTQDRSPGDQALGRSERHGFEPSSVGTRLLPGVGGLACRAVMRGVRGK